MQKDLCEEKELKEYGKVLLGSLGKQKRPRVPSFPQRSSGMIKSELFTF